MVIEKSFKTAWTISIGRKLNIGKKVKLALISGNQYLDAVDVTSQPSLRAPGMIDDLLISDGLRG